MEANFVHRTFEHGKNFKIGKFNVIQNGCQVGDNIKIEHFVLLKKNTKIGNNVYVDSYFRSSGNNKIGNNVTLRFGSTIAREVTVKDDVFISPNVMTIYSTASHEKIGGTVIGKGAFIGTNAVIGPGIKIGPGVVIGSMAYINRDCLEPGVYVGIPARKIKDIPKREGHPSWVKDLWENRLGLEID